MYNCYGECTGGSDAYGPLEYSAGSSLDTNESDTYNSNKCSTGSSWSGPCGAGTSISNGTSNSKNWGTGERDGYSPYKLSMGDSESALREFRAQKGKQRMSFAMYIKYFDFALIAADTRMSYGENNNLYRDDYRKIAVVPGTDIVVASTGLADFRGNTFKGIISSFEPTGLEDFTAKLIKTVKPLLYNTTYISQFLIATYNKEEHVCLYIEIKDREFIIKEMFEPLVSCPYACHQGAEWAVNYMKDIKLTCTNDVDTAKSDLFAYMGDIIEHGEKMPENSTVGGNVDMILLRPNKAPEFLTR
jgi:hypothetical protein